MELKVLPSQLVYVLYQWDGYNGDWSIKGVYTNLSKARKIRKEYNLQLKQDNERDIFNEDGSVNYDNTDSDDRYYDIVSHDLII